MIIPEHEKGSVRCDFLTEDSKNVCDIAWKGKPKEEFPSLAREILDGEEMTVCYRCFARIKFLKENKQLKFMNQKIKKTKL